MANVMPYLWWIRHTPYLLTIWDNLCSLCTWDVSCSPPIMVSCLSKSITSLYEELDMHRWLGPTSPLSPFTGSKAQEPWVGGKTMDIFKRFMGGDGIMCCVREVWTGDSLGLESIITLWLGYGCLVLTMRHCSYIYIYI